MAKGYVLYNEDGSILAPAPAYGELYIYEGVTSYNIQTVNVYHLLHLCSAGSTNLFTSTMGATGSITAYADAGGGYTTVTAAGHTLTDGQIISIVGTTNYNGIYAVSSVGVGTFQILKTYTVNDATGTWTRGCSLKANTTSTGTYLLTWTASVQSGTGSRIFQFEPVLNTTQQDKAATERFFSTTDTGALAGCCILSIAPNDYVSFSFKNQTDTSDLTFVHFNMNIVRLS